MREYLFRGQTRRYGEKVRIGDGLKLPGNWVYGGICHGKGDFSIIYGYEGKTQNSISKYTVYTDTVGLCTGLTDRTRWEELTEAEQQFWLKRHTAGEWIGKPIFEGDIVAHYNDTYNTEAFDVGVIYWDQSTCMFLRTSHNCFLNNPHIADQCDYKVIGNIYDNPELTKTKETIKYDIIP